MSAAVMAADPSGFAERVTQWHEQSGRHDLPWQQPRSAYRVWVSEIMLQQTQVATVIDYFNRFMRRFPGVVALADAPLDEVLHLWSGLGYYTRARNLHACAIRIRDEHDGVIPLDPAVLAQLPGIGRSTAAAIVALAGSQRAAILDGNVKRVLSRYFAVDLVPGTAAAERRLWELSEQVTPAQDLVAYTQGIMDLGATLCVRSRPLCALCPLAEGCRARALGQQHRLPRPRRRAQRGAREAVMLLAVDRNGAVLLEQRPATGIWGGLWSPPEFHTASAARAYAAATLVDADESLASPAPLKHAFTHFDLTIVPLVMRCRGISAVADGAGLMWYDSRAAARVGLPAPVAQLLDWLAPMVQPT
ncbi:MAG: A/G-specific adenine glycosylase [Steroidobacteraceae bacterium]